MIAPEANTEHPQKPPPRGAPMHEADSIQEISLRPGQQTRPLHTCPKVGDFASL